MVGKKVRKTDSKFACCWKKQFFDGKKSAGQKVIVCHVECEM